MREIYSADCDMESFLNFLFDIKYIFLIYILVVNILAFILCGIDKKFAENRLPRVRERTFYFLSFIGGAALMLLGMCILNIKLKKAVLLFLYLVLF